MFEDAFNNLAGYEDVKLVLKQFADGVRNESQYKKFGTKPLKNILLHGEVGTGKTSFAKAFINATGKQSLMLRKSGSQESFLSEIRETFSKAEELSEKDWVIVLLDDVDKFSNVEGDRRNTEEFISLQTCIDEVQEKKVFVIATANNIDDLPNSLIRKGRFAKIVEVLTPNLSEAKEIIKSYLSKQNNLSKDIDIELIAKVLHGRSCADLEAIINEASAIAVFENKSEIDMDAIIRGCLRAIFNAEPSIGDVSPKYLESVAVHETGHLVVQEYFNPGFVNLISIEQYRGEVKGFNSI